MNEFNEFNEFHQLQSSGFMASDAPPIAPPIAPEFHLNEKDVQEMLDTLDTDQKMLETLPTKSVNYQLYEMQQIQGRSIYQRNAFLQSASVSETHTLNNVVNTQKKTIEILTNRVDVQQKRIERLEAMTREYNEALKIIQETFKASQTEQVKQDSSILKLCGYFHHCIESLRSVPTILIEVWKHTMSHHNVLIGTCKELPDFLFHAIMIKDPLTFDKYREIRET